MRRHEARSTPRDAYEGVDSLDGFTSADELEAYRRRLLSKSELELEFIRREIGGRVPRVLELGAGNGRLLIALALAGIAQSGLGLDIAQSRVSFARRWAADLGLDSLEFVAADVSEAEAWPAGTFDLVIAISNLLEYLGPVHPDLPAEVVRRAFRGLSPTGCLLLEFYQLTARHRQQLALGDNQVRTWMPLPEWDRFAYYLSDITYEPGSGVLHHAKTFIGRDGTIDTGRVEHLSCYTAGDVLGWLAPEAVGPPLAFRSYLSEPHTPEATQTILVIGGPQWQPPVRRDDDTMPAVSPNAVIADGFAAWR